MSIRPVDVQMSIQKVDQFTKDFNYNGQQLNLQEDQSQRTEKQAMEIQSQVVSAESAMQNRVHKDGGQDKGTGYRSSKGNKKEKEKESKAILLLEEDKGAFIDISI